MTEYRRKGQYNHKKKTVCFSPRKVPESPKDASGSVAGENCFQHQLPNRGLLLRDHDLFKMLFNCPWHINHIVRAVILVETYKNKVCLNCWDFFWNLDEEDGMASAGSLVKFSGRCSTIKAGGDKVFVKIWGGGDGCVSEASDKDVLVLVLSNRQILRVWWEKIENLRERKREELINFIQLHQMYKCSYFSISWEILPDQ